MLQRFKTLVSEIGSVDALLYLVARSIGALSFHRVGFAKFYLVSQPVHPSELTPPRRGRSIEVREADTDTIRATDFGRPREAIEYRLRHGCRCLLAHKDQQLLGFQWFSTGDYPEDQVRCLYRVDPADRCAWDFDIFVRPEARMLPTFARLWDHCNAILRELGIEQALSRIDAFNATSRRAHGKLGARTIGWAVFLSAGAFQAVLFSSAPWLHVSTSRARSPEWRVSRLARRGNSTQFADSNRSSP